MSWILLTCDINKQPIFLITVHFLINDVLKLDHYYEKKNSASLHCCSAPTHKCHTHTLNDFYLEDRNLSDRKWFCLEDIKQSNTNSFFVFLRFSCMPQFLGFQMKWIMTPQNAYFYPTQVVFLGFEHSLDYSLGRCEIHIRKSCLLLKINLCFL